MRIIWLVTGLILATAIPGYAQVTGQLTVVGQGSYSATPDMATITLGVTAEARTAEAALSENSADTAKVLGLIARENIAPKDIQTSGLSLSPLWNNRNSNDNSRPSIIGYSVSNRITIRVRDLERLGFVLDAVVSAGATQFNGLRFGLQDPVPATDKARRLAVGDAKRKASLYADAAEISLGQIVQISEAGGGGSGPAVLREMAVSSAVPIAQGEVAVTASVTIVYEIQQ